MPKCNPVDNSSFCGYSGERSFSKLKLIKTYFRTSMLQERLVGLDISIEHDVARDIDLMELTCFYFCQNESNENKALK